MAFAGLIALGVAHYIEKHRAYLEIESDVPGTLVVMDDRLVGTTPIRLLLRAEDAADLAVERRIGEGRISWIGYSGTAFSLDFGMRRVVLRFADPDSSLSSTALMTKAWEPLPLEAIETRREDRGGMRIVVHVKREQKSPRD